MTRAKRQMQEDIKLIDLVIELLDARIPLASRNPDIDELCKGKARLVLLNKSDLADDAVTDRWADYFASSGILACKINCRNNSDMKQINAAVLKACEAKIERDRKRGIRNRPVRAMVVGIPNVGKSTFINSYAGRSAAKTGNRPGVTKGKQWICLSSKLELLDTPGILWPKFEDQSVGLKLALTGAIRDEVTNTEELALSLIRILDDRYPGMLSDCYFLKTADVTEDLKESLSMGIEPSQEVITLYKVAKVKGALKPGGVLDTDKAAAMMLENFRNGKIGRFSLEDTDQI